LGQPDVERAPREAATAPAPVTFEQLYHEHFDFTFRTLRHLGVQAPALHDAVQDVWLAVHRQLNGFEGRSSHRTWLFSIALNTARNVRRWRRRHDHTTQLSEDLPDQQPGPEQLRAGREALGLVEEFLATLDEEHRVLFISQLLERLSAAESAQLLGIDTAAVYHRVRDLRRGFKRWLLARSAEEEGLL
jgi:RNA polymerase sigma-70 factor (ECF subfamily)